MDKKIILLTAGFGGAVGGYVPVLFGADSFGGWGLLGAFLGGIAGIWVGYRISEQ